MVSSASGQDGAILPAWEYPLYPARKNFDKSHKKFLYWPSLFGQGVWILALFFFCEFMDLDFFSAINMQKKNLANIQPLDITLGQ